MLSASLAIVVAASAALRSAAAATLQASPGGSGTACSSASPCALADALSSAEANDDISLAGARASTALRAHFTGPQLHRQNFRVRVAGNGLTSIWSAVAGVCRVCPPSARQPVLILVHPALVRGASTASHEWRAPCKGTCTALSGKENRLRQPLARRKIVAAPSLQPSPVSSSARAVGLRRPARRHLRSRAQRAHTTTHMRPGSPTCVSQLPIPLAACRSTTQGSSAHRQDVRCGAGGTYTGNFVIATPGLTVQPAGAATATIVSAETPNEAGLNVALTIAATGVTVTGITVTHGPNSEAPDPAFRDVGIFVTPTSGGVVLSGVTIARAEGRAFEPATGPGSRGLLVFDTADVTLQDSTITGAYEDAVHLPARDTKARAPS